MRCNIGDKEINHTHIKFILAEQNRRSGNWPDLLEIQKYLLEPSWKDNALAVQESPKDYLKKRGTTFDITFTTEPGNKPSGIHVSNIAQQASQAQDHCVRRLIKVMTAILEEHLHDKTSLKHRNIRWAVKASITAGNEDSRWLSHIQINVTKLEQDLGASLKRAGHAQFDKNDMVSYWTVIYFLSQFPENYHPGLMAIYSTRVCCPCKTYGAVIMTGMHPHSGKGKGFLSAGYTRPPNQPVLKYPKLPAHLPYTRLHAVGYPRNNNIQGHALQISNELTYIKAKIEVIKEDPQYWCDKFSCIDENGATHKPRIEIAQMCFQYAAYAWLDHPDHKNLHKALLASGVGTKLPLDENAPARPKRAPRPKRPIGAPIPRVTCDGICANGKRCSVSFQVKADGNTRCGRHTKKTDPSDGASKSEEGDGVMTNAANDLKRTFSEMDALDNVAALSMEDGKFGEGEESWDDFFVLDKGER
ncbi:hypothetical protein N431DRAFT_446585 [Stipitochalara longipes BDJ]|nr:hypothetical protein N431DRAFT_446585 [Stipitochalara longipes BDJ]